MSFVHSPPPVYGRLSFAITKHILISEFRRASMHGTQRAIQRSATLDTDMRHVDTSKSITFQEAIDANGSIGTRPMDSLQHCWRESLIRFRVFDSRTTARV